MITFFLFIFSFWFGLFSSPFEFLPISSTNGMNTIELRTTQCSATLENSSLRFIVYSSLDSSAPDLEEKRSLKNLKPNIEKGEILFMNNCTACHLGRNNLIIPEKDLKKDTLEANGINTVEAITYQIKNGKNGMPAFGGRLSEQNIRQIAKYLLANYINCNLQFI